MKDSNIQFLITPDQAKQICDHYGKDINNLSVYEICKLLDQLIDETTIEN